MRRLKPEWISRLVTSAQELALYRQEPWNLYRSQFTPVSFRATGWFDKLLDVYRDFETRHRQAMWEATYAIYLPVEQRDRDQELVQLYR